MNLDLTKTGSEAPPDHGPTHASPSAPPEPVSASPRREPLSEHESDSKSEPESASRIESAPEPVEPRAEATTVESRTAPEPAPEAVREPAPEPRPAPATPTRTLPPPAPADGPVEACRRLLALVETARNLEARDRSAFDDAVKLPLVPYCAALLRMKVLPALANPSGWPADDPLHVVLCGGTNSGKSTVLNLLLGRSVAVMNPTARYSQHPEAYKPAGAPTTWLDRYPGRFEGYQRYVNQHPPRQSDRELFRDGYVPAFAVHDLDPSPADRPDAAAPAPAPAVVHWDAPDFSTEQARAYLRAVIDSLALGDVVVFAVTEESYADDRGLAFLRMITNSGVATLVAANKLPPTPEERRALVPDMRGKIRDNRRDPVGDPERETFLPIPRVPGVSTEARLEALLEHPEGRAFREAVRNLLLDGTRRKRKNLLNVVDFLDRNLDAALRPLVAEVEERERWAATVQRLTEERFLERYRLEYLNGKGYGEFNRTLVRLIELLQLPRVGPLLNQLGNVVRAPMRLAGSTARRLWHRARGTRPDSPNRSPEHEILDKLLENWIAELRARAQALGDEAGDPAWTALLRRIDSQEFLDKLDETFFEGYLEYRREVEAEEIRRARRIHEVLETNPALLNSLRGGKAILDVVAIGLVLHSGGLNWSDAVVGPVVAGLMQLMVEGGLKGYLDLQRDELKQWQMARMRELVQRCLVESARDLFPVAVGKDRLDAARADFALVKTAAARVAAAR